MQYDLVAPFTWISPTAFAFQTKNEPIAAATRLLLGADGSMTRAIEMLRQTSVALEVRGQEQVPIDPEWAAFLATEPLQPAIARRVWLTAAGRREVFAESMIPLAGLAPELRAAIELRRQPLGLALGEDALPSAKDRVGIGRVRVGVDLGRHGLEIGRLLWARRYRLAVPGRLTAAIVEILGPNLSDA